MIFLHLESFENKLFELNFLTFKKRVFTVKPPEEGELVCTVMTYFFFEILAPFHIQKMEIFIKKLRKVSDHFVEKIRQESTTLKLSYFSLRCYCCLIVIETLIHIPKQQHLCSD